jgi:hypothetical protein
VCSARNACLVRCRPLSIVEKGVPHSPDVLGQRVVADLIDPAVERESQASRSPSKHRWEFGRFSTNNAGLGFAV